MYGAFCTTFPTFLYVLNYFKIKSKIRQLAKCQFYSLETEIMKLQVNHKVHFHVF